MGLLRGRQVAPHLEHFLAPWCGTLRLLNDGVEKEHAFQGLCQLVRQNPQVQYSPAPAPWAQLPATHAGVVHMGHHMLASWQTPGVYTTLTLCDSISPMLTTQFDEHSG